MEVYIGQVKSNPVTQKTTLFHYSLPQLLHPAGFRPALLSLSLGRNNLSFTLKVLLAGYKSNRIDMRQIGKRK